MTKKTPPRGRGKGDEKVRIARDLTGDQLTTAATEKKNEKSKLSPRDSAREMIESVVIAFVLAFLFRTFEAEAFVIPTGSMAPTLMGQHKDLVCDNCKYPYRVSASDEEGRNGRAPQMVTASICPICRYQMDFGPGGRDEEVPHATYKGDRILVAKFPYEFSDPERWDVAVFKNPGEAKQNYIKRVVGLPNETVVLWHGDVHTTREELFYGPFDATSIIEMQQQKLLHIERKPPAKVEAMLQVVHDNDYRPAGVPLRWSSPAPGWARIDEDKGFAFDGKAEGDALCVYQHLVPTPDFWRRLRETRQSGSLAGEIPPQLITDFYAYNTNESQGRRHIDDSILGNYWVGDLAVECRVDVEGNEGELLLQLVEGGLVFECRIDVATGQARFVTPGEKETSTQAQTTVRGPGNYRLRFANVDDQLLLWVNGKFISSADYARLGDVVPTPDDLAPVRLGVNGLAAQFSELRVLRDVYYIVPEGSSAGRGPEFFAEPSRWGELLLDSGAALTLAADRFMVCGDNSPRSYDSRLWTGTGDDGGREYYVKRELLIGKAVYIYWPHTLPIPGLPDKWWFQLIPNVPRMGFVR
jgi:signal peptidase I